MLQDASPRFIDLSATTVSAPTRERLCREFHSQLYSAAFTNPDQIEKPETWLALMNARGKTPELHLILALPPDMTSPDTFSGPIWGGVIIEFYPQSHSSLVTYIVVAEDKRSTGIGAKLLAHAVACVSQSRRPLVFAEVEKVGSHLPAAEQTKLHRRRLILGSLGFAQLPFAYVQPALSPDQQPDTTLDLLILAQSAGASVSPAQVEEFLKEFFQVLGQDDSPSLSGMVENLRNAGSLRAVSLVEQVPESHQRILGTASDLSLRLIFMTRLSAANEMSLADLRRSAAENRTIAARLIRPIESFYRDAVLPYTTEDSLPLIACCEGAADAGNQDEAEPPAVERPMEILFPPELRAVWENREVCVRFAEDGLRIPCRLIDTLTIFDDATMAYAPTFVFDGRDGPLAGKGEQIQISAPVLLALLGLIESEARGPSSEPSTIRFNAPWLEGGPRGLSDFVSRRLEYLAKNHARTVFSLFSKQTEGRQFWRSNPDKEIFQRICSQDWSLSAATVEINGSSHFDRFLAAVEQSQKNEVAPSLFNKQLAALAQNVLDFVEQDADEIADSLCHAIVEGNNIVLTGARTAVQITVSSRSFGRMLHLIGGSPYFLLTTLALTYNDQLLRRGAHIVEDIRHHIRAHTRNAKFDRSLGGSYFAQSRAGLQLRYRLLHEFRSNFLPNLFRYQMEKNVFDRLSELRGIYRRFEAFDKLLDELDAFQRDVQSLIRQSIDAWIGIALFALGFWQFVGVLGQFWHDPEKDFLRGTAAAELSLLGHALFWITAGSAAFAILFSLWILARYIRGRG